MKNLWYNIQGMELETRLLTLGNATVEENC